MRFTQSPLGWRVSFVEEDLKTPLHREFIFQDSEKVLEMAERGGADRMSADKEALRYGVQMGRGSVWLRLTAEQYAKLQSR